jgi:hypothetical protein
VRHHTALPERFSLAPGLSSLRSDDLDELRRTRRSLGDGGHPRRELTLIEPVATAEFRF